MSDEKERMVPADRSNWNAILKWSMAQQGDGTSSEPAREISEEDRRWLLDAMASGFIDEIKRMKDIIACISAGIEATHDAEEIDARLELMEELTDRVSGVDNGGDLHTLGGLEPLVRYVASSPHARLRAAAAEVLGTTVQNHPKAQEAALGCDAMGPLLRMAAGEGDDAPPTDAAQAESATTAHLLESFRESRFHGYLQTLASRENYVDDDSRASLFLDTLSRLLEENNEKRRLELLEKARISGLGEEEKQELRERLGSRTGN